MRGRGLANGNGLSGYNRSLTLDLFLGTHLIPEDMDGNY